MEDWDDVSCFTIVEINDKHTDEPIVGQPSEAIKFTTTEEILDYIREFEINENTSLIESSESSKKRSLLQCCCPFLTGKYLTSKQNIEKVKLIRIAGVHFDDRNDFHMKCLFTLYSKLTGDIVKGQRRFGAHWEEIGFQGSDPATDFRGVGFLGLLQVCNFVVDPESMSLARDIYLLSLHQVQHFPFTIMSMNITQMSLQALKKSMLDRAIVQSNSTIYSIFHRFYVLLFRKFYNCWLMEHKTITDTGYILQDLRDKSKKFARELMNNSSAPQEMKESGNFFKQEIEFSNIGTILD